jgi:hypothetical protein
LLDFARKYLGVILTLRSCLRYVVQIREQHRWLRQVLNGHYQYFGVIFNYRSLRVFKACVVRDWRKVLGKRSQKGCMNWANYRQLLIAFPLPEPVIHQAWRQ